MTRNLLETLLGAVVLIVAIGFFTAFFSALIVIKALIAFVSRHGFVPFAYYRIALGIMMAIVLATR